MTTAWRRWSRLSIRLGLLALGALALLGAGALSLGWAAFGKRAEGERRARMERSPQWKDGRFNNPQPLQNDWWGAFTGLLHASTFASPELPLGTHSVDPRSFETAPPSGLRLTWLGHACVLIEIDGHRLLTDPVWSDRASPLRWLGPQRWYSPPLAIAELPELDAVLISHDHYDHLDRDSVVALAERGTRFVVPLGIGAHLAYWGVPEDRIVELDWWERATLHGLDVVSTPARHASGRVVIDNDQTLWSSYALLGPKHRAFFSGDTGLFPAMNEIGERFGPFDVTMIEVGQYHRAWPDWHIGPEQAVQAHGMLRGRALLPMHWGLFTLAYHGWTEPAERVLAAARSRGVDLLLPRPGQSVEPEGPRQDARWWPEVPWEPGEQHPIVSSGMTP